MATLYERLAGIDGDKIPLQGFFGMMRDVRAGNLTAQNVIDAFNLDAGQTTEAQTIFAAANTAADPIAFIEKIKAHVAAAEITDSSGNRLNAYYNSTINFMGKVNE